MPELDVTVDANLTSNTSPAVTDRILYVRDSDDALMDITPLNLARLFLRDGEMWNGKLSVTVTSNNLIVALKTAAGTDPTSTDFVLVKINGTVRTVTAALSITLAAATNWYNAGSAELAAKEIDYFMYAIWDSNSSVVAIAPARIPFGRAVSDFDETTTNAKYLGNYANYSATDDVAVIGRFAATLSAGAGYTWTVPTYTNVNLIQHPIYETRALTWTPAITYVSGTTDPTSNTVNTASYRVTGRDIRYRIKSTLVRGSGDRQYTVFSFPFTITDDTEPGSGMDEITAAGLSSGTVYAQSTSILYIRTMANDGRYFINGIAMIL